MKITKGCIWRSLINLCIVFTMLMFSYKLFGYKGVLITNIAYLIGFIYSGIWYSIGLEEVKQEPIDIEAFIDKNKATILSLKDGDILHIKDELDVTDTGFKDLTDAIKKTAICKRFCILHGDLGLIHKDELEIVGLKRIKNDIENES